MIVVNNLIVTLQNQIILKSISCELLPGRITLFIGKSGAGKTTILKSLIGLIPISSGTVTIDGISINSFSPQKRAQLIGYVFQAFNLFPHITVIENCIDPLLVQGVSYENAYKKSINILEQLGMKDFITRYPCQLSGGQQQRVAIARALCLNPHALLLDEPTASLDPESKLLLIDILKHLVSQGLIIAISSQDMPFVNSVFDRIYYIDSGQIIEFCDDKDKKNSCLLISKFL